MFELNLITTLQIIVGLGLLNVWLVRRNQSTLYRGGSSLELREEFAAYGLPTWFFYFVGGLKISSGIALIVGLWVPSLVLPAAALVALLMVGALAMHMKVRDALIKFAPAALMLGMSGAILTHSVG